MRPTRSHVVRQIRAATEELKASKQALDADLIMNIAEVDADDPAHARESLGFGIGALQHDGDERPWAPSRISTLLGARPAGALFTGSDRGQYGAGRCSGELRREALLGLQCRLRERSGPRRCSPTRSRLHSPRSRKQQASTSMKRNIAAPVPS